MAKRTTVLLTTAAQTIAEKYEQIYSLKSVLSAGVIVLNRLKPEDREKAIAEANDLKLKSFDFLLADLGDLSPAEEAIIDESLASARSDILSSRNRKSKKMDHTKAV